MSKHKTLFWNVDTQEDFIDQSGKLYVQGAEAIRPVLKQITDFAKIEGIRVINTCDYHHINSNEISSAPDYETTFPPHCLAGSSGAEFISETLPESPLLIDWDSELAIFAEFDNPELFRNVVIRKDAFDVFAGNPHAEKIVQILNPDQVFVYGVSTNVCVDKAVIGLAERGVKVFVFNDAIKELPNLSLPFESWTTKGVVMIPFADVSKYL
ncbi:MAG TPA: isochorismatase family cysteine hydrolase [Prolixibacteraceae bacterium]|jgi:nicotinamidase/pyrazinamidase